MTTRQDIYTEVDKEIERAKKKYPPSDYDARYRGFASEAGEALQATQKWIDLPSNLTKRHARLELIQSMGQHVRALEEMGIWEPCPVCQDTGLVEDVAFNPDFGPSSSFRDCQKCTPNTVREIHWVWKVFFIIAIVYIVLVAMGVL